jgi:HSP20 family protein
MKEQTVMKPESNMPQEREETREPERSLLPPADIFEYEDGLAVVVDLPGVPKDGVDLRVEQDILTIKAAPAASEKDNPVMREYELRPFFRQFQLGEQVDQEKIEAQMRHGVLTIRMPKVEKAKPRKIAVDVAS